jgi:hypothetical protein
METKNGSITNLKKNVIEREKTKARNMKGVSKEK